MNASSFDHVLRKVVYVPVSALLLGAIVFAWQMQTANTTVSLIEEDDIRLRDTLTIEKLMIDEETSLRGYEITHDPQLLDRFYEARSALPKAFAARRSLIIIPSRVRIVDDIHDKQVTWEESFANPLMAMIQAGGQTNDLELNLQGKRMMDDIRREVDDLNVLTEKNRDNAIEQWHRQLRRMVGAVVAFAILGGLVLGLYIRRLIEEVSSAFRRSHQALQLRADQAFRSEEKLRTTLQSLGEGVITCDEEGLVQSINDAGQSLTGWTEEEARNQPLDTIFRLFDEVSGELLESPVARVISSKRRPAPQDRTVLRRRDGTELFIEDSGTPIHDKHGALAGVVIVFRDVTLQRKSQLALLASEKLAVAGRLAASIAHEIHNPLDSVSNLLYLMNGEATPEEHEHFLALAQQEIDRVTHISRAMLSLYRESKAPVSIDMGEMLQSILLLMEGRFRALEIQVETDFPEKVCVEGFPVELRQVFTNLLANAAEAAGAKGRISLRARPVALERSGSTMKVPGVFVDVSDDGPGIPEEVIPNLFQPFFTTKGERGTGLGLWISRGIVTKHGGSIELSSSTEPERHGTTLSVFLATHPTMTVSPG